MKKLFIKICKFLGYEIIDQNSFSSPTLDKELNEDLSILNQKSIILPLGEVKITKKVNLRIILYPSFYFPLKFPKAVPTFTILLKKLAFLLGEFLLVFQLPGHSVPCPKGIVFFFTEN